MDSSNEKTFSALMVLVAATLWGTTGLVSKPMMDAGMTSIEVASSRVFITAAISVLFVLWKRRDRMRVKAKDFFVFIIIGFSRVLSMVLLFFTQQETYLTFGIVMQMTAPCFVIVIMWIFMRRGTSYMKCISAAMIVTGCMLVAGVFSNMDMINVIGLTSGILSGVTSAVFTISSKVALDRGYDPLVILMYCFVIGAVIITPFVDFDLMFTVVGHHMEFISYMLILGILMTFLSYYLNFRGVKGLAPAAASILATMELIVTVIVGFAAFGQSLTATAVAGVAVIVIAMSISQLDVEDLKKKMKSHKAK